MMRVDSSVRQKLHLFSKELMAALLYPVAILFNRSMERTNRRARISFAYLSMHNDAKWFLLRWILMYPFNR